MFCPFPRNPSSRMHRWLTILLAFASLSLLAGTSPMPGTGAEPTATESVTENPVSVHANLSYRGDQDDNDGVDQAAKSHLCDVYLPSKTLSNEASADGVPVVLVIHGGGWMSGSKWALEGYSRLLAKNGIAAVTINYRLAPAHPFPAQVDDVREALLWIRNHQQEYNFDLSRLGLFGYSAGGHLSLLVASLADEPLATQHSASDWEPTDARWQQLPTIACVCVGGPPCDFRSLPPDNTAMAYFLGGSQREKPDAYVAASPMAHVSPDDPPTYIIHGDKDLIVPIAGAKEFHQAQLDANVSSHLETMPGQGHMITFINPKTSEQVVEFFRKRWLTPE